MRHRLAAAASALALTAVGAVGSSTSAEALPGTWTSPNVEHLLTIPDAAAVSAKFVNDANGKAQWMYLSTWQGLSIYDVSNPALPLLTAKLPLPNFENEDIDGNANIAIVSTDGLTGGVVYVIDTSNKRLPVIKSTYVAKEGAGHTSNCVDNCERYIYTATGDRLNVVDIADPANPKVTLVDWDPAVGPAHDVDQDDSGIVWMTGYNGGAGFAIHPLTDGVSDAIRLKTANASPTNPVKITDMVVNGVNMGSDPAINDFILHNSKRELGTSYRQTKGASRIASGGVLAVTEEDYVPNCEGQGRFHTFDATGSVAKGEPLQLLDTFKLAEGTLDPVAGERALGTVFCSAHWFTVKDNIVAIGWYGAGHPLPGHLRPARHPPGRVRRVGRPADVGVVLGPGQRHIVYSVDVERGLDVLRFTPEPDRKQHKAPGAERTKTSFLAPNPSLLGGLAYACPDQAERARFEALC
jgi:hypothetical protein